MVNRKFVSLIGYIGTCVIWAYVWNGKGAPLYSYMWFGYMLRRALECLFVHIWEEKEINWFLANANFVYLWTFSSNISGEIYSLTFEQPDKFWIYLGLAFFCLGNLGNFYTHYILRVTKLENRGKKNIPSSCLFKYISCPHYTFELLTWIGFYLSAQTTFSGLFMGMVLVIIINWGRARHSFMRNLSTNSPNNILIPLLY